MSNSTAKFTPVIELPQGTDGLRLVTVKVRNSESRYPQLTRSRYAHCDKEIWPEDFPVKLGEREVVVAIFPPYYFFPCRPTSEMVAEENKRRKFTLPDRIVTEAVLKKLQDELVDNPTVGFCGEPQSDARGLQQVGYVSGGGDDGIRIGRVSSRNVLWDRCFQFMGVVSEVLIT